MIVLSTRSGAFGTDWDSWHQIEVVGSRTATLCVENQGIGERDL